MSEMITIETERLAVRNFSAGDWQDLQELVIQYQKTEYAQYDHAWPTGTEEIKEIVRWFAGGDAHLAVCLKASGKLIGLLALDRREDRAGRVHNLGYIFHPGHQGRGFATESCRAAMAHLFGQLAADGILTGTHPANEPSVQLLKRLGLNEIAPGEFAISRKEWQARRQALGGHE